MRSIPSLLALLLCACASSPDGGAAAPAGSPWDASFRPPLELDTTRVHLEPLAPRHVELDHAALMGSREHLRRTMRWGDWPRDDFTVQENLVDMERHWAEFEAREAYAYTVLSPDRERCIGCIYVVPDPGRGARDAVLAYWVIEPELATDLDHHLLGSLLEWFELDWPLSRVGLIVQADDARGLAVAREAGFVPGAAGAGSGATDERSWPGVASFVWTRPD